MYTPKIICNFLSKRLELQSEIYSSVYRKVSYSFIHPLMSNKRLKVDICPFLRNALVNAIITRSMLMRMLNCVYLNHFLPLLTYGLNVIHLSACQLNRPKLNIAWNNVYRRIFGMKPWESVKEIQFLCGRLDFKCLIDLTKMRFCRNSATCSLCILQCCLSRTMRSASYC